MDFLAQEFCTPPRIVNESTNELGDALFLFVNVDLYTYMHPDKFTHPFQKKYLNGL